MDPYDLARFRRAQDEGGTFARALEELRAGHKRTHWMWFVFPQIAGLGRSRMADLYAIRSLHEAQAYLADPVLGPRLREAAGIVAGLRMGNAEQVFGPVDALKLRSSMTLFTRASPRERVFREVLERFYGGAEDPETNARLRDLPS